MNEHEGNRAPDRDKMLPEERINAILARDTEGNPRQESELVLLKEFIYTLRVLARTLMKVKDGKLIAQEKHHAQGVLRTAAVQVKDDEVKKHLIDCILEINPGLDRSDFEV